MNFLLDTHVFLWWDCDDKRLAAAARKIIADPTHSIYVSAASVWEIAIKSRLGKLALSGSAAAAIGSNGFVSLAIQPAEAETAGKLDWSYYDPFDRLLIAQAEHRSLTLITADAVMRSYPGLAQLWAAA